VNCPFSSSPADKINETGKSFLRNSPSTDLSQVKIYPDVLRRPAWTIHEEDKRERERERERERKKETEREKEREREREKKENKNNHALFL
jgi:hypothetical protein